MAREHVTRPPAFHEFASREALAAALAAAVAKRLKAGIAARGGATLAVSGGTTPAAFFDALSCRELDWTKIVATLVDERFVPPSSDRSNEKLVRDHLLANEARLARFIPLVPPNTSAAPPPLAPPLKGEGDSRTLTSPSPLKGDVGGGGKLPAKEAISVEQAARAADAAIALLGQPLDVVVLGMGADGHTASFFPDAPNLEALTDTAQPRRVMPVHTIAGGEPRLTLTLPLIANARFLALHIEGDEKRAVLDQALSEGRPTLPIRSVLDAAPTPPHIYWTA